MFYFAFEFFKHLQNVDMREQILLTQKPESVNQLLDCLVNLLALLAGEAVAQLLGSSYFLDDDFLPLKAILSSPFMWV